MSSSANETPPTLPLLPKEAYIGFVDGSGVGVLVEVDVGDGPGVNVAVGVNVDVGSGVLVGVKVGKAVGGVPDVCGAVISYILPSIILGSLLLSTPRSTI